MICYLCKKPFGNQDPVYRRSHYHEDFRRRLEGYPSACHDCATTLFVSPSGTKYTLPGSWEYAGECKVCGRRICRRNSKARNHLKTCSPECARQHQINKAKGLRRGARMKKHNCLVCHNEFEAARRDALVCSSRCRTKLHRQKAKLAISISALEADF
jgi:hypothetical protein